MEGWGQVLPSNGTAVTIKGTTASPTLIPATAAALLRIIGGLAAVGGTASIAVTESWMGN